MVAKKRTGRDREHEKLVEEIIQKVKKELTKSRGFAPVGVKFPSSTWRVYTYHAPKDHGLSVGDKVQTPTGPAIVETLEVTDYDPTVSYKRLRGKYAYLPFEYES